MTILCRPETGLTIEANAIYVLNTKSQGSTTWSDLQRVTKPCQYCKGLDHIAYNS